MSSVVTGLAIALGVVFVGVYLDMPPHPLNFMWLMGAFVPVIGLLAIAIGIRNKNETD